MFRYPYWIIVPSMAFFQVKRFGHELMTCQIIEGNVLVFHGHLSVYRVMTELFTEKLIDCHLMNLRLAVYQHDLEWPSHEEKGILFARLGGHLLGKQGFAPFFNLIPSETLKVNVGPESNGEVAIAV